jgi:hypothetical protein
MTNNEAQEKMEDIIYPIKVCLKLTLIVMCLLIGV